MQQILNASVAKKYRLSDWATDNQRIRHVN